MVCNDNAERNEIHTALPDLSFRWINLPSTPFSLVYFCRRGCCAVHNELEPQIRPIHLWHSVKNVNEKILQLDLDKCSGS